MYDQAIQTTKQETDLEKVLAVISAQNSRFIGNIQTLEGLGHRLRDTNVPHKDGGIESGKPSGILDEIGAQLDYYSSHNSRLENIISKLQTLL